MARSRAALLCWRLLGAEITAPCSRQQLHTATAAAASSLGPRAGEQQHHQLLSPPLHQQQQQQQLGAQQQQQRPWQRAGQTRGAASDADLRVIHADLSEDQFHKAADDTLDQLQEQLEGFVEDLDVDGGDVEHAQGVLTVKLGSHGTYVINKQTPNRQLWLSSPVSGPFRYDYQHGQWVYNRDGRELLSQLQQELGQLLGSAPDLS